MSATLRRFFILVAVVVSTLTAMGAPHPGHVFIISIDGGKPAVIAQSRMPVLKKLVAEGAHTWTANTIFPSTTLPSHTSMLTGVVPDKHRILWNEWIPAKGIVTVPTIFSEAKKAGHSTAMFVGKEKFRHLLLPGSVDKFQYNVSASTTAKKFMAGQSVATDEGTVSAETVASEAATYIVEKKPDLCFIHFADPDVAGHKYNWGSPQQMKSFTDVDTALGVIIKAIQDAGIAGQSVVIVTADHGGHLNTHGLNIPDDMNIPWIVWGEGVRKDFEITAPVNTVDTAATALWLLNVPAPESFDGRPVTSAFE